jgi:hypothetical protein
LQVFVFALVGIVLSLRAGAIVPFIAASLVVGLAQGAASTAGIRALLAGTRTGSEIVQRTDESERAADSHSRRR